MTEVTDLTRRHGATEHPTLVGEWGRPAAGLRIERGPLAAQSLPTETSAVRVAPCLRASVWDPFPPHPPVSWRLYGIAVAIAIALLPAVASAQPGDVERGTPTHTEILRALDEVKADPNLATERTIRTLRWKDSTTKPSRTPAWLQWIAGLFQWIAQGSRVVVWAVVAVLAALLLVYIARFVHERGMPGTTIGLIVPTHVRDLDIRPESLPVDIGAAARTLWSRGEHRAALALLYRGLLSRLAHVHQVPVKDSSTEGDCLALAVTHLTIDRSEYTSRLIRVWQRAVYGGVNAETSAVYALCDGFAPALDPAPDAGTAPGGTAG